MVGKTFRAILAGLLKASEGKTYGYHTETHQRREYYYTHAKTIASQCGGVKCLDQQKRIEFPGGGKLWFVVSKEGKPSDSLRGIKFDGHIWDD